MVCVSFSANFVVLSAFVAASVVTEIRLSGKRKPFLTSENSKWKAYHNFWRIPLIGGVVSAALGAVAVVVLYKIFVAFPVLKACT